MERKTYLKLAALFLLIIYSVGRIGLVNETYSAQFQSVTWLNLVITTVLVLAFHRGFTNRFLLTCIGVFAAGFIVEWIGVKTGKIFGEYQYGKTLGWKLDEIPLLIGVNWLVLVYGIANFLKLLKLKTRVYLLIGASLMVLLDFFMEPFAIKYDLWLWKQNAIPLQNYVGWFVVSLPLFWFMYKALKDLPPNYLAVFVYFIQLAFFISFFIS